MTAPAPKVTALTETAALYALLQGDQTELNRIIDEMFPNERSAFAAQLQTLIDELGWPCDSCGTPTPERKVPEQQSGRQRHLCEKCAAPETQESGQSA